MGEDMGSRETAFEKKKEKMRDAKILLLICHLAKLYFAQDMIFNSNS